MARVGYERVNKRTGKKVEWSNIVKGFPHSKGKYVVLTDEDLKAANVEATHTIDIDRFVELVDVEPLFFERPYYVKPDKAGGKAYVLLREALANAGRVGIAKVVLRTRQHLAALLPRGDALVLMLMRFHDELREAPPLDLPDSKKSLGITPKERQMATQLVESMAGSFEPDQYRDDYRKDLLALVRQRAKRGELNEMPEAAEVKPKAPTGAKVIDLMALLEQSLKQPRTRARASRTKKRGKASSARAGAERQRKSA
jgi:DNA end-binding protein Ku